MYYYCYYESYLMPKFVPADLINEYICIKERLSYTVCVKKTRSCAVYVLKMFKLQLSLEFKQKFSRVCSNNWDWL